MISKVIIKKCEEYNYETIRQLLEVSFKELAIENEIPRGGKVFIKVNNLLTVPPERAVTTHPLVLKAVIAYVKQFTDGIIVGDDVNEMIDGDEPFVSSGFKAVCDEMGVRLLNLKYDERVHVTIKGGVRFKKAISMRTVVSADYFINLPKMKTHQLTLFTGAIKNLYGIMPFGQKVSIHKNNAGFNDFKQAVVDVYSMKRPDLNVMDAVIGMEGEGPSGGPARTIGYLMISRDGVSMDAVCENMIGLRAEHGLVSHMAAERGLGIADLAEIDLGGVALEELKLKDFKLPKSAFSQRNTPNWILNIIFSLLVPRPVIDHGVCKRCGACIQHCPKDTIKMEKGKVIIHYDNCIRCFCCQELCSFKAIRAEQNVIGKVLLALHRFIGKIKARKK
ncbi:MAG: DUF362 domain-containing protein [Candidatus Omnitrophica bacterium]|nr:DUF362 domain-containing protein [Candidatus Omnitrophota bacterium]